MESGTAARNTETNGASAAAADSIEVHNPATGALIAWLSWGGANQASRQAMTSISTRTSRGSRDTWTVDRAGGGVGT